jgi:manganese oxidase
MTTLPSPAAPTPGEERRDVATLFVFVLAAIALIASVSAVGFGLRAIDESEGGSSTSGVAADATATVSLVDFGIDPSSFTAPSGGSVAVSNHGGSPHNLAVEGTDARTDTFAAGDSGSLSLAGVEPGTYVAFCEVPGHREAGMEAELTVTEGSEDGEAVDHAAHGAGGGSHTMTPEEMDEVMAAVTKAFPAKTQGQGAQDLAPTVLPDGTKEFQLTVDELRWEVEPGKFVDAKAYNGQIPGPTMRVDPGDKVRFVVRNEMEESTAVHFHGVDLPNAMDGMPDITQPPIRSGETFVYEWTTQRTPAVGMYHSHHNAAEQVPDGLAGAFLIGRVATPHAPVSEHVMMLNDAGTIGFSLNGKSFPATTPYPVKQGEWVLFHYLNEGVMAHPMHLHGLPQLVVAKDGFPVEPYQADTINVAPGERYSVLVQATVPGVWAWHCHILPHAERSTGMFGMVTAMIVS